MTVALSESIPDFSYYQNPLDGTLDKRGLIFRMGDGNDFLDPNFAHNLALSQQYFAQGRIDLFGIYHVYRPVGAGSLFGYVTAHLPKLPDGAFWMWDIESWGRQITGDHSGDLNALYGMTSGWAGDWRRTIAYANFGDFAELYPGRDPRCLANEAGYGNTRTHVPGAIAKQWTNGQPQYDIAGLSPSTQPFGRCDHNVFIGMSLAEAAVALGITKPAPPPEDEDEMADKTQVVVTQSHGTWALRPDGTLQACQIGEDTDMWVAMSGLLPKPISDAMFLQLLASSPNYGHGNSADPGFQPAPDPAASSGGSVTGTVHLDPAATIAVKVSAATP